MDILDFLVFSTFLIIFPLGNVFRFELGNGISVIPIDLITGLIFFVWFIKKRNFNGTLTKSIFIFIAALGVSLIVNIGNLKLNELGISFLYLLRLIFYFSLYFLISGLSKNSKKIIQKLMIFCGAVILILGIVQYLLYPNLRNLYYLGWDEHLYRMFSTFLDPNFAGAFFVLYFIYIAQFITKGKVYILLSLITFFSIILTYSRSAYLMFLVSMMLLLIMKRKYKLIVLFLVSMSLSLVVITKISLSSEGTNLLRTASNDARLDSAKNALAIIKDHRVFGVGFNSYRFAQKKYNFIGKDWENIHSGSGTDNSFLFLLATSGIIGFIAFIYLNLKIIKFSRYSFVLLPSIIGILVDSLFVNSYFYPFILFWIIVLVGLKEKT